MLLPPPRRPPSFVATMVKTVLYIIKILRPLIPVAPSVEDEVRTTKDETVSSLDEVDGRRQPSTTGTDAQNWLMRQTLVLK